MKKAKPKPPVRDINKVYVDKQGVTRYQGTDEIAILPKGKSDGKATTD